jgi:hypothetical protein
VAISGARPLESLQGLAGRQGEPSGRPRKFALSIIGIVGPAPSRVDFLPAVTREAEQKRPNIQPSLAKPSGLQSLVSKTILLSFLLLADSRLKS